MAATSTDSWAGGRSEAEQEKFLRAESQRRADFALDEAQRRADDLHAENWRRIRADHEEVSRRLAAEDEEADRRRQAQEDFRDGKNTSGADPKAAEPKADTPKTDPPKPDAPDAKGGKPETNRFSPAVGKTMTKMGVPPSAVRNLRAGEPVAGVKGLAKGQWGAGQHYAGKLGGRLAKIAPPGTKLLTKATLRALPVVGSIYAAYSAYKAFEKGDYIGAALNVLGVIPGPVGWIGLGLATLWDLSGWGNNIGEWDQPDGTNTHMLQAAAKEVAGVTSADALIRQAQADVFRMQDGPTGTVWDSNPPAAVRLDTAEVKAAVESYLTGLADLFQQIDKAMIDAGEQYFTEQRSALSPHLAAMAELRAQVQPLMAQFAAVSDGAKVSYDGVLTANRAARQQISEGGTLSDSGPAATMRTNLETGSSQISAANGKIEQLFAGTAPAVVAARTGTAPTGTRPAETKPATPAPTPVAVTPASATPAAQTPKSETPKSSDDLSKLLSQLGQQAKVPTQNPLGTNGSGGLGGGSPLRSQGLGGGQGGGTPLSTSKPDTSTKSDEPRKLVDDKPTERKTAEKKLSDDKSLSGPKPEQAKSAVPTAEKPVPAAAPVATPAPAAGPTPAQQNAAAAKPAEPSKEVDVKGNKTTFPDAKTAKLAQLLSQADPTHPVSLADAASKAGLTPPVPGQDPGKQVPPADAKPGDIMVAGDKNYMLLGGGKFYDLTDYKVVGASELPQQLGDRAGYFHLADPAPGQPAAQGVPGAPAASAAPAGPVSGQTGGTPFQVPNATGAPQGPVDGNAAPPAPGGVPAAGTPGVPKPGTAGSGPANSATTDTGVGQGLPSSEPAKLDPAAVR
ncbi:MULTISPECIES: hypothetical protein [Mycobacteroides]|uniref:hypothetical protein n=1 Tax=Mycobacteroides TaxID=670516 RepID=UPI0008A86467|nr:MULTISPECIES: hypothetical protein [Mycobacteroides]AYM40374.1 hypothetical protein DYE20_01360 [[Mycobacterium] chelonae subsp. gwanakae]OHU15959.1 hypothetical protein BKG75_13020 [Mycobacteroides chelonae]SIF24270.1 Uncharacterised protein [Mycobacteroides abscessus subsp. abscessus]SIF38046.1 Uncharacterised protein [Mycobacteroides abscessus subsp. abscessus]SIF84737.1 Uncharacterised protein [Mycobacteroides abscessus subsp. abscessus]